MNREESKIVIQTICSLYPQFEDRIADKVSETIDAWHRILKKHDHDTIMNNLDEYAENNKFAPSVAELVQGKPKPFDAAENARRYVPNAEETAKMMEEQQKEYAKGKSTLTREQRRKMFEDALNNAGKKIIE